MALKEINNYSYSDSEESNSKKESQEFNISYIFIKIDDHLSKKKYLKIVKEILKIEKENKSILSKKENIKYFVYLFEIKILCLCKVIEGKIADSYIYRKNAIIFNSKAEQMKNLEKYLDKLKKILEEDMLKLKNYMKNKNLITENMKEHIILSYARAIYLQGKFCKLKKQITDAASFFNIGINLIKQNINKSIESETYVLYAKFLLSLSCLLIEDNSYIIASEKIVFGINFFIKALFLTIDNPNGINIDDIQRKIKNNSFIFSIKGLIISLFLLGICLERLDLLDNALTLYNQSYWLFKKFFKNIDPIFFSIIESITNRINKFQEDINRELKNKFIEEKKLEKLRLIEEKNILRAIRLTNIANRGSFNSERYLQMEQKLKYILSSIEKKYGRKDEDGKIYLPIIKYLNFEKNKFDFTFNYLVKEKEKQMEKKIKLKSNTNNKNIKNLKTESTLNNDKKRNRLFKSFNFNFSNKNIHRKRNNKNEIGFNLFDKNSNNIKKFKTKSLSPKDNLKKTILEKKNLKLCGYEETKSESNEHFETKTDSNIFKSNSINTNFTTYNINKNNLFKTLKNYNSFNNKVVSSIFDSNKKNNNIKQYILSNKNNKCKQKEFLTKNSFVFCKSFRKGIKYLEKMDKREMDFQKQLINLKDLELGYEEELENIKNLKGDFSKEKIKEEADYIYLNIKDKIDDKFKNDNTKEITGTNEKSKELEKIMIQKMKLENSLIMGLNEAKIDEIRKLEHYLEEINQNQYIKMLSTSYLNAKKNANDNEVLNDIEYANKKNNQMMDSLDNEIIRCEQKNMAFKKSKKKFYLPNNLKKFKING